MSDETPDRAVRPVRAEVRVFGTGATRSADAWRDDPEGFWSPLVIDRFNAYMSKHRVQADGGLRESDNWQNGMPLASYVKGGWRHFLHWWTRHRGYAVRDAGAAADIEEDLCALLFNVQGYLHELLVRRHAALHEGCAQVGTYGVGTNPAPADAGDGADVPF